MALHTMQRNANRSDMTASHAAVSYYAGCSYFWGFYWYAYFTPRYQLPAVKN